VIGDARAALDARDAQETLIALGRTDRRDEHAAGPERGDPRIGDDVDRERAHDALRAREERRARDRVRLVHLDVVRAFEQRTRGAGERLLDLDREHVSLFADDVRRERRAVAGSRAELDELVAELVWLRQPITGPNPLRGVVASRMWHACVPFSAGYITPMAAVAGSVAQELIACYQRAGVRRAWVNNGGDIALHLEPGEEIRVGIVNDPRQPQIAADARIAAGNPARGIATSGWRGRSQSLGIADAVTALARTASQADAAATIIANAVDLPGHPAIVRCPANELQPDSDLGARLVTRDVGELREEEIEDALGAGVIRAQQLLAAGLIEGAALRLLGETAVVGSTGIKAAPSALRRTARTRLAQV